MSAISVDDFLELLRQSHVLSAEQWTLLRRDIVPVKAKGLLRRSGSNAVVATPPPQTADELAQRLIDRGWLTRWQADMLMLGRPTLFLGKYRLLECIGAGGMGAVFKAQQGQLGRTVALKVMAHDIVQNPKAIARFRNEIQAVAALDHPHIVAAYDADCVKKVHFLVMEYVDGHDLGWYVNEQEHLPIGWACECIRQAALGLQHAHECGMVHRDIKPTNLLVARDIDSDRPLVKLLDLGLARFTSESGPEETDGDAPRRVAAGLTQAGQVLGSPDYMAPEQAADTRRADARSDIFSLGCTLFRLLTGQVPFAGDSIAEKITARQQGSPRRLSKLRPETPPQLRAVVAKMMARDPNERYQTALEVAEALSPFTGPEGLPLPLALAARGERSSASSLLPLGDPRLKQFFDHLETRGDDDSPTRARRKSKWRRVGWSQFARLAIGGRTRIVLAASIISTLAAIGLWRWVGQVTLIVDWPAELRHEGTFTVDSRPVGIPAGGELTVSGRSGTWDVRMTRPGYEAIDTSLAMTFGERRVFVPEWHPTSATVRQREMYALAQRATPLKNADRPGVSMVELRDDLIRFRSKSLGSSESVEATRLLAELPSPLDRLSRNQIPEAALRQAGLGKASMAPPTLVGILGDGRLNFWDRVTSVSVSHDGRLIAAAGKDGTVRIFDRQTSTILHVLPLLIEPREVLFSPVDETLAIAGDRKDVLLCDARRGEIVSSFPGAMGPLAFSAQGQWLAAHARRNNQIVVYETSSGLARHNLPGSSSGDHRSLVFSPDAARLAVYTSDQSILLRDLAADRDLHRFPRTQWPEFSPDGTLLATGSSEGDLKLWDGATGALLHTLTQGGYPIAFSPDGKTLISYLRQRAIVWDLPAGRQRRAIDNVPVQVVVSPDGNWLAAAARSAFELKLWNLTTGELRSAGGLSTAVTALAFTPDSISLITGDARGAVRQWDLAGRELQPADPTWGPVAGSPDGRFAAIAAAGKVEVWDLTTTEQPVRTLDGAADGLEALEWSPHGRWIAGAGGTSKTSGLRMWDAARGTALPFDTITPGNARTIAFNSTGQRLVSGNDDHALRVWDAAKRSSLQTIQALTDLAVALALDSDRHWLAAADRDGQVVLWNLAEHRARTLESPPKAGIHSLAFSPGGRHLVAAAAAGVLTWDVETGKPSRVLRTKPGNPSSLSFSPSGDRLAAVGNSGTLWLWKWEHGEVPSDEPDEIYKIGPAMGLVRRVYWSLDGRHVLTVNGNSTLYVLRLPGEKPESE
ncbi:MAG: hypothetical protein EXS05_14190 [Planctomycetaceae bacterium]|nr:hypothetical protein [Planctomycetaceae bacterium]